MTDKINSPQLSWSPEQVPYSEKFEDFYFSTDGGLAEVNYVFLQHNQLQSRFHAFWAEKSARQGSEPFTIAETGFGTGLNFLTVLQLWSEVKAEFSSNIPIAKTTSNQRTPLLHFVSFEKFPLRPEELQKAHAIFPELAEVSKALLSEYPSALPGWHDVYLFNREVRLTLWFGDVLSGLPAFDVKVDAWFLDGFTPSRNPEMWQPELYSQMARLSAENTTFATFTSAGEVRRGLEQAGFSVQKDVGFGVKREMCFGHFIHQRSFSPKWPWFSAAPKLAVAAQSEQRACVIGAGLAGATVAYQLAELGWQVTVLEAETEAATQASGNLAGAIHPLVTADWNLRSQFYLQGLETTLRWLKPWLESGEIVGELNGLMQLLTDDTQAQRLQEAFQRVNLPEELAVWCSAQTASDIIGTVTDFEGVFFPQGGWVYPKSVVQRCLQHANITVNYKTKVTELKQLNADTPAWQILTEKQTFEATAVVVATGALSDDLNVQLGLPIRPVKGQVSHFKSQQISESLKVAVTHQGYSCAYRLPDGSQGAVSGATFEAPDRSLDFSEAAHQLNVQNAKQALPDWISDESLPLTQGKVGFRPTTPDHLPIIGALVDSVWAEQSYYRQSHTHAVFRYEPQRYRQGLYVSNGHGARGLMSVFLAAEIIASQIMATPAVLPNFLGEACHPERFRIRKWRSGKNHV